MIDPYELPPDQASIARDLASLVLALWRYPLSQERLS